MEVYLIIAILLASIILPLMMVNKVFLPSDNKIQLSIVDQIRSNKHRFIHTHKSFLFCDKMMYPQFLFWILSFLSMKQYRWAARYLFVVFHFLSAVAFIVFVIKLQPVAGSTLTMSNVLLYTGAVYILTPFSYNINNAKNTGISTRGLGLFLGQVVLYSTVLYIHSPLHDISYLVVSGVCMWLILIGSAFSLQMLFLVIPAWAIIIGNWMIAAPLLGAFAFFFITTPRYALNYITGQFNFKVFYFKYLAKNILLAKRYSVWRDFIWDFWKIAFNKFRYQGKIKSAFNYVYNNPAIAVIIGMPFSLLAVFVAWQSLTSPESGTITGWITIVPLPVFLCFGAFILTSFRITRFLGEPERYVEFSTGLIAVSSLLFQGSTELMVGLLSFCALLTVLQLLGIKKRLKDKAQPGFFDDIQQIEAYLDKLGPESLRILSNNNQISKLLISESRKVFFGWPYSEKIGSFHFNDIYKSNQFLKKEKLVAITREFEIDYFVLDKMDLPDNDEIYNGPGSIYHLETAYTTLNLYSIRK